ncbi:hypothetical protein HY768_05585 [candidate division TA06 bacterium]|uniref:Nuclear transport factor 2 family protein n=1 Tax=candidate division TA06 bacterium TaxID=2250710 RepID=A0A933MKR0_UNCT6|nr:hypothetical protein [candidate division TA06 bacterium]
MKRIILCLACILICSAGFLFAGKPNRLRKLTEQEKIQMVLANLRQAAQHGEANEFINNFSKDYKDADSKSGNDHAKMKQNAADFFSQYKPIDDKPMLYIYDTKISIGGNIATVDCKMMLMARSIESGGNVNELFADQIDFVKEGEVWKIGNFTKVGKIMNKANNMRKSKKEQEAK